MLFFADTEDRASTEGGGQEGAQGGFLGVFDDKQRRSGTSRQGDKSTERYDCKNGRYREVVGRESVYCVYW